MLPDDDRIVETCRSILNNFICLNVLKLCTGGNNKNNCYMVHGHKSTLIIVSSTCFEHPSVHPQEDLYMKFYMGADKSLARPWKETNYSDQDLQHYTKTYGVRTTGIYCCCLYAISLGRCSLFPSRVGLRLISTPVWYFFHASI